MSAWNVQFSEWKNTLAKCSIAAPTRSRPATSLRRHRNCISSAVAQQLWFCPIPMHLFSFIPSHAPSYPLSISSLPLSRFSVTVSINLALDPAHGEHSPGACRYFRLKLRFLIYAPRFPSSFRIFVSRRIVLTLQLVSSPKVNYYHFSPETEIIIHWRQKRMPVKSNNKLRSIYRNLYQCNKYKTCINVINIFVRIFNYIIYILNTYFIHIIV